MGSIRLQREESVRGIFKFKRKEVTTGFIEQRNGNVITCALNQVSLQ
jgi:hypothetical protein